jgi:3-hydroxyacyl-[acyl-carrier-protein] dehydratase
MLDRIVTFEPDVRAVGIKCVSLESPYFEHHFPDEPLFPATLHLEAMAQTGGYLLAASEEAVRNRLTHPVLQCIERARFMAPVRPGDRIEIEAVVDRLSLATGTCRVSSRCDGRVVARAILSYALGSAQARSAHLNQRVAAWRRILEVGLAQPPSRYVEER